MKFGWLKARQTKYTAYVTAYILVIIALLGTVNWLANRHNASYDSTQNKSFSLSPQTEKVVRGLSQDVNITYFDETRGFTQARDLLGRYENLSTKLHVEYIDPYKKPQIARTAGVKSVPMIVVEAGPKREEARNVTEEEITSTLIRALKTGERSVCFVTGSGEHLIEAEDQRGFSNAKALLEKNNYTVREISLLEKPEVPKDCTILAISGPRFDYPARQVEAIKSYVESGGRAMFLLDPPVQFGKDDVSNNAGLRKMLDEWGVTLEENLVLDASGVGQLFGLGPEVPLVATYETHPIVRDLKGNATAFPISRSVETKSTSNTSVEKLFSSSSNSFVTTSIKSASLELDPKVDKKGPFNLAAAGTYKGAETEGRFVVVGSSDWASNYILGFQANRDLFMNMMNWLSSDEDLISIRPKEPGDSRLNLTVSQMRAVFYSSVILLPLMIIGAGFAVWWRRR